MKRRTTILKRLRENIEGNLTFAGWDEQTGDKVGEAYRRGVVAAYASALKLLLEEGSPEWLEAERVGLAQANRISAMRSTEETA